MKNIRILITFSFILFFSSCVSNTTNNFNEEEFNKRFIVNSLPKNTETEKYIEYENGFITIELNRLFYYKFNDKPLSMQGILNIYYNKYGEMYHKRESASRKYFNINGKPVLWSVESITPEVAVSDKISQEIEPPYIFRFINEGIAAFKVKIGEIETTVNITIKTLPFSSNVNRDELVEKVGFHDKISTGSAIFPSNAIVDGITYHTVSFGEHVHVTHLYYDKFPELIIVYESRTNRNRNQITELLLFQRSIFDTEFFREYRTR